MLLKGLQDVEVAPDPREAAEMALLRLIHAADLPDPSLADRANDRRGRVARSSGCSRSQFFRSHGAHSRTFRSGESFERGGKHNLAVQLHDQVGVVRYAPPELVLKPAAAWRRLAAPTCAGAQVGDGREWQVSFSDEAAEPSLLDQEKIAEERVRADVLADPNVRAVMDAFPEAELEILSTKGA